MPGFNPHGVERPGICIGTERKERILATEQDVMEKWLTEEYDYEFLVKPTVVEIDSNNINKGMFYF